MVQRVLKHRGSTVKKSLQRRLDMEPLEQRHLLATIQVLAAGVTNDESIELRFDGETVRSWSKLGGNAYGGQFVTLEHQTSGPISPNQVRVAFTNDLYNPSRGYDRNVRIDAIVIDGIRYETESPIVYSTGTWKPQDGIVPGFRQSEFLHTNGYFQYAEPVQTGSLMEIRARGNFGGERFEVRIDGATVRSFEVTQSFQTFSFRADSNVTADQVRIAFVNDRYEPANNIDYNLQVDYIAIDSVVYQTEAPNVYSTGTWKPADGIQPGFRQSEWLHTNGYFHYGQNVRPGEIQLEDNSLRVAENGTAVIVTILRLNGSDGTVTVDYRTVGITATPNEDFVHRSGTVTFAEGETRKEIAITIIDDLIVEGDEQFAFTIDNVGGGAILRAPRTATVTIEENDSIRAAGNGLLGEYFDNINFTNRFINRIDATVNFDWGPNAPATGMGPQTFSVRWSGRIEPRFSEQFTFHTLSDDGIRLWVNSQLIIDRWQDQPPTTHSGSIFLQAGVLYDIRIEYYQNLGWSAMQLRWESPSQPMEIVPMSQLYAADPPPIVPGNQIQTQNIITGLIQPTAVKFSANGRYMFIAEKRGTIRVVDNGILQTTPFLDFRDRVNDTRDRGLIDIEVHPQFPEVPFLYLFYTYDPPQVNQYAAGSLAGPDGNGNRAGRLTRVTADSSASFTRIVPNSEVVIVGTNSTWNHFNAFVNSTTNFNEPPAGILPDGTNLRDFIATDSESHTVGGLKFALDGSLFVSIGDGTSYNQVDPRTARVQDIDNLSGKILRIDPLTGRGLSTNPFFNGDPDANRSKVYQYGLRNPFRLAVQPTTGQLFIGDVGWTQWEEVNSAPVGANFGWPWYEGGNGTSLRTGGYQNLPAAQAFYASGQVVTPSIYAQSHSSGINAIVLGDVYAGNAYPAEYRNNLFFNDLGRGIVQNIRFNSNGTVQSVGVFATGHRYVVQITQGPDGNLYYADLDDGRVGRWVFPEGAPNAAPAGVHEPNAPLPNRSPRINGGVGVTVAVIDSGVDIHHPLLERKRWINPNEVRGDRIDNDGNGIIDDIFGYDFVDNTTTITDPHGHGTFIAGMIAGGKGTQTLGIAPGAKIMPLRVLDASGIGSSVAIANAIRYAVDQRANIITLPLVSSESEVIRAAIAHAAERGVLIVAAAGNSSADDPSFPANLSSQYPNVVSAGALEDDGLRLPESNRNSLSNSVQIEAPGIHHGILPGGDMGTYRGTSVSAAWISATAALVWSRNPLLTASQVRELLVYSSDPIRFENETARRLNVDRAVQLAQRSRQVAASFDGQQLKISGTMGNDHFMYSVGENGVRINGIRYRIDELLTAESIVFNGRTGSDWITIDGSEYVEQAVLRPGQVRLSSGERTIAANGFRNTSVRNSGKTIFFDSDGDDRVTVTSTEATMNGDGFSLNARKFSDVVVHASTGFDRAYLYGSPSDDQWFSTPRSSRLLTGSSSIVVHSFDRITADLGEGNDRAMLSGSTQSETLTVYPRRAYFSGIDFEIAVHQIERLQAFGQSGTDFLFLHDGQGKDRVISSPQNTRLLGNGYEHEVFGFRDTTILSSGHALDMVTLIGSTGKDAFFADTTGVHIQGIAYVTRARNFANAILIGNGGNDESVILGSMEVDRYQFSPELARWSHLNRNVELHGFAKQEFDGNLGFDTVELVDGYGVDVLALATANARLTSHRYQLTVSGMESVIAESRIDEPEDTIVGWNQPLDYAFSTIGDWLLK